MYGHLRPCSFMTGHAPGSPLLCTRAPVRRATGLLGQLPQSQILRDKLRATTAKRRNVIQGPRSFFFLFFSCSFLFAAVLFSFAVVLFPFFFLSFFCLSKVRKSKKPVCVLRAPLYVCTTFILVKRKERYRKRKETEQPQKKKEQGPRIQHPLPGAGLIDDSGSATSNPPVAIRRGRHLSPTFLSPGRPLLPVTG